MNREEAQFILAAYRPNGEDATDLQFREALSLVKEDPEMARWFAENQAIDRVFAAKIHSWPMPPNLKAQLLLARTTARCTPRWRQPRWLVAAVCVGLLLTLSEIHFRDRARTAKFVEYRESMARNSLDMTDHFEIFGLKMDGFKQWIAEHHGDPHFVLPPALAEKGISACKVFEWEGCRVTMLCFKFSGQHADIFILNASKLPGNPLGATPQYFVEGELTTAVWRDEKEIYLLASAMPKSALQHLL